MVWLAGRPEGLRRPSDAGACRREVIRRNQFRWRESAVGWGRMKPSTMCAAFRGAPNERLAGNPL